MKSLSPSDRPAGTTQGRFRAPFFCSDEWREREGLDAFGSDYPNSGVSDANGGKRIALIRSWSWPITAETRPVIRLRAFAFQPGGAMVRTIALFLILRARLEAWSCLEFTR